MPPFTRLPSRRRTFGETTETLRTHSHRPVRKALAHLGSDEAGVTFAAIGACLNLTGEAVSHLVAPNRGIERGDAEHARRLRQIRMRLSDLGTGGGTMIVANLIWEV